MKTSKLSLQGMSKIYKLEPLDQLKIKGGQVDETGKKAKRKLSMM